MSYIRRILRACCRAGELGRIDFAVGYALWFVLFVALGLVLREAMGIVNPLSNAGVSFRNMFGLVALSAFIPLVLARLRDIGWSVWLLLLLIPPIVISWPNLFYVSLQQERFTVPDWQLNVSDVLYLLSLVLLGFLLLKRGRNEDAA